MTFFRAILLGGAICGALAVLIVGAVVAVFDVGDNQAPAGAVAALFALAMVAFGCWIGAEVATKRRWP